MLTSFKKSALITELFLSEVFLIPVIKKISVQKNNPHRFNVFFEKGGAEEYAFSISEEILIKYQLKKGMELDDLAMEEIFYYEDIQKAYHSAINFLSYRMRSEKEISAYLKENGYTDETIQEVIFRLNQKKYLNNLEFALAFVKTQMNTSDKGPKSIKSALKEKGISEEHIEEALALYDTDLQLEKAIKLATKWAVKKTKLSKVNLKNEMQIMLQRKGYTQDVVNEAIKIALEEIDDGQELDAIKIQGEKAWQKYGKEPVEKRKLKVKQFLFRKGFSLDLINQFIENVEQEEW